MQVTLPTEDHRRAARRAADLGISLAEYLRRLVRRDLDGLGGAGPPGVDELIGLGDSGGSDVAAHKREYLADSLASKLSDPG